jgi:hypothetical protein
METVNCEDITSKCVMLPLIENITKLRNSQDESLGSLGPCTFSTVSNFIANTKYQNRQPFALEARDRDVVAIGDIHADFIALLGCMYTMSVIDMNGNWIGGNTIVVLCGDLLDREGRTGSRVSVNTREEVDIVQYINALNLSAEDNGGAVIWVLGNHDLSRVFSNKYKSYRKYVGSQIIGWVDEKTKSEDAGVFMDRLFAPGGPMGVYIATHCVFVLTVGKFVFVHGSFNQTILDDIISVVGSGDVIYKINTIMRNSMLNIEYLETNYTTFSEIAKIAFNRSFVDGYTTQLKVGLESDIICTDAIRSVFRKLEMSWNYGAFVVGHSIQKHGIPVYCRGRIWRLDLGMSEAFRPKDGRPKIIGGIRITQFKKAPFNILTVMNYGPNIDKFTFFISSGYSGIVRRKNTILAKWIRSTKDRELTSKEKRDKDFRIVSDMNSE